MSLRIQKVDQVFCLSGSMDANQSFEIVRFFEATLQLESTLTLRLLSPGVRPLVSSRYFKDFQIQALLLGKQLHVIDQAEISVQPQVIQMTPTNWSAAA